MSLPTIRTITLGLEQPHPLSAAVLQQAAQILQRASARYQAEGYVVHSLTASRSQIPIGIRRTGITA